MHMGLGFVLGPVERCYFCQERILGDTKNVVLRWENQVKCKSDFIKNMC